MKKSGGKFSIERTLEDSQEIVKEGIGRFINIQPDPLNKILYISATYTVFGYGNDEDLYNAIIQEASNPIYKHYGLTTKDIATFALQASSIALKARIVTKAPINSGVKKETKKEKGKEKKSIFKRIKKSK